MSRAVRRRSRSLTRRPGCVAQGHGLDASLHATSDKLPSLMMLEAAIFGPYNLLGFSFIPPELRPSVKGLASLAFSIGLSIASC